VSLAQDHRRGRHPRTEPLRLPDPPPDPLDLRLDPVAPSRVRRNRARHRRAAVGGAVVWLGETVLAGVGFAAMILAGALTSLVLAFLIVLALVAWLARDVRP
jgi:hypothetical protein